MTFIRESELSVGFLVNWDGKLCSFSQRYVDILEHNSIKWVLLDPNSTQFLQDLRGITHFIFRHSIHDSDNMMSETLIPLAEEVFKIPCLPNSLENWLYDDKIRQSYLFAHNSFAFIKSWVFWREKDAIDWLQTATFPLVLKLPKSAGGQNVVLVQNKKDGIRLLHSIFRKGVYFGKLPSNTNLNQLSKIGLKKSIKKNLLEFGLRINFGQLDNPFWRIQKGSVLFQEFLPNNQYDVRVTVLGKRAFVFRRHNRRDDFRASGSGLIDYSTDESDLSCVKKALQISQLLGFQSMAYDFIFNGDRQPFIVETSYSFNDQAVYNCPGFWDLSLNWHSGNLWPQYSQLVDLLALPDLIQ